MKTLQLPLVAPFIAIGLFVMTTTSRADTLPDYYPRSFAIFGVLSGIDTRSQIISIDDRPPRWPHAGGADRPRPGHAAAPALHFSPVQPFCGRPQNFACGQILWSG